MGETPTSSTGGPARSSLASLDPVKWAPILQLSTGLVSGSRGDSKGGSEMTSTSTGILLGVGTLSGLLEMSSLRSTIPCTKRFSP
ncbi:hypothetical protein M9H77_16662 [Catharanthus roseus]|uniref:Uncharacterized protein n=1 Tax=Catharanthus roseus TaxID=4058 RepID=A0ACC0B2F3_CATRO|nr:hypothetical protein M9H77_16662 [Catharanthus roseus]